LGKNKLAEPQITYVTIQVVRVGRRRDRSLGGRVCLFRDGCHGNERQSGSPGRVSVITHHGTFRTPVKDFIFVTVVDVVAVTVFVDVDVQVLGGGGVGFPQGHVFIVGFGVEEVPIVVDVVFLWVEIQFRCFLVIAIEIPNIVVTDVATEGDDVVAFVEDFTWVGAIECGEGGA
jgi:hypothetical protein